MAVNTNLVSMAEQFTGLPMGDLIGAPLKAAADANAMMAVTQTKFLLDTAFSKEGENGTEKYVPIMVEMELTRGVLSPGTATPDNPSPEPSIQQVKTTFNLPLLTILPLNSLGVDDVTVKFDMEVKSSFAESESQESAEEFSGETSFTAKMGYGFFSATVTGSASYESSSATSRDSHYEKSNSAQYSVSVHAGQLPLPDGVKVIIGAFTSAIEPITMPVNSGG